MILHLKNIFILLATITIFPVHTFAFQITTNNQKEKLQNIMEELPPVSESIFEMQPETCIERLKKEPQESTLHACLAIEAMKVKNWDEAIAHWNEAIQYSREAKRTGYYMGLATSYLNVGMIDAARVAIEETLEIDPDSITLHYWMASFWEEKMQSEKAKDFYKKILPLRPTKERPRDYYYHAYALLEAGNEKSLSDAEKDLNVFLKFYPDHYPGWTLLGYTAIRMGKPEQAVEDLSKGESIEPDHIPIHLLLSQAYLMMGKEDPAIDYGNKVLHKIPHHLTANYLVGTAYLKKGETEKGVEYLNKATGGADSEKTDSLPGKAYLTEGKVGEMKDILKGLAKQAPKDPSVQISIIKLLIQSGKLEEAIIQCNKVLKYDRNNDLISTFKVSALLAANRIKEAETLLKTILSDNSKFLPAEIEQIRLYKMQEKFDLALLSVDRLIKEKPNYSIGYRIKGDISLAMGDRTAALNAFKMIVKLSPNDLNSWTKIFSIQLEQSTFSEAEETANHIIRKFPGSCDGYFSKGIVSLKQKKTEAARTLFQKVIDINGKHFKAHNFLGLIAANESMYGEAIQHYEASLKIFPRQPLIYYQLGRIYVKAGDNENGLETARRCIDLFPGQGDVYALMAVIYMKNNNRDKAVENFKKAISLEPKKPAFYINLGAIYKKEGALEETLNLYKKALWNIPGHPVFLNNIAWIYVELGHNEEALTFAEKAEESMPNSWVIKNTLGWIYYKVDKYDNAINKYNEAISINDENPSLQFHIAQAYVAMGEKQLALKHLKKAESHQKPFPEKKDVVALIQSLESR